MNTVSFNMKNLTIVAKAYWQYLICVDIIWSYYLILPVICIYACIYENNRMKTKDRVLSFTHKRFYWCCFSSWHKGCYFVLFIWRCLGIKCEVNVILRICYFSRLCDLSLFIEQRFEFIYNSFHYYIQSQQSESFSYNKAKLWQLLVF